jgi:organic radical activating enzyme
LGGEGALTADLLPLAEALQDLGFYIALETDAKANNYRGTGIDWVCVAANIHGNDTEVNREAVGTADELRFFIYRPQDIDFTIAFCAEFPPTEGQPRTISVQPVGQSNELAKMLCVNQGLAYGWRVSMMAYPEPRHAIVDIDHTKRVLNPVSVQNFKRENGLQ